MICTFSRSHFLFLLFFSQTCTSVCICPSPGGNQVIYSVKDKDNWVVFVPNAQTVVTATQAVSLLSIRPKEIRAGSWLQWKLRDYRKDPTDSIDAEVPAEKVFTHVTEEHGNFTVWLPAADLLPGSFYSLWMVNGTEILARSQLFTIHSPQMFTILNPELDKETVGNASHAVIQGSESKSSASRYSGALAWAQRIRRNGM
ncbi:hypothetical protein BJ508DRAFT_305558 [Ascobolus immersus RN42]|uniref:Uncharacterized protein n=1 Tax=Ascobolus immersus RN42 TaxID=1160509 RepID=A0A3N4I8L3_ASCIM|nr:hypothetical protein BJ508DRAFT_305558 [Ascobolus immersus RN42]